MIQYDQLKLYVVKYGSFITEDLGENVLFFKLREFLLMLNEVICCMLPLTYRSIKSWKIL